MSRSVPPRALLFGAALFLASAAVLLGPPAPPTSPLTWLRALAALLLLGWFPGWVVGRLVGLGRSLGEPAADRARTGLSSPERSGPAASAAGGNRDDLIALVGLPCSLSPILSTGLIVLVSLTGAPVSRSAWAPVLLTGVLLAVAAVIERGRLVGGSGARGGAGSGPQGGAGTGATRGPVGGDVGGAAAGASGRMSLGGRAAGHGDRGIILLIVGVVALLVAINLANPWLRWRADGRFHIGVTAEMLRAGIPPTDPFFAGLNLQYMWFFHAWLAGLAALSRAATSWLMVATNMLGLVGFLTLAAVLARDLGRSKAGVWITVLVTGFGMGGLSWALLPVKLVGVFTGAKRGMDELGALFALWPPTIQKELGFLSAGYDQPFLLRKFLVGTAMSLALAALLLQLVLVLRRLRAGSPAILSLIVVVSPGAIILHPMVGIPAVAVGIVAALAAPLLPHVEKLFRRLAPTSAAPPVSWGRALSVVLASIAGVAMALPYMKLVTAGKQAEAGLPIDFFPMKVVCLTIGSLGLSVPAFIGLVGWWRRRSTRDGAPAASTFGADAGLAVWAILLAGFALFVKFPLERANIDKPTLLVHLAAALTAGGVLGAWWDRGGARAHRRIVTYLGLLIVPTHLILLTTYALESDPRTYRPHEKKAHAWLREHAPAEAIVFDSLDRDRPGVEIPRRMFWSHDQFAVTHQYPVEEMNRRREIRDGLYVNASLFQGGFAKGNGSPGGTRRGLAVAALRPLPNDVFVLVRAGEALPGVRSEPFGTGPIAGSFAGGDTDPLEDDENFERVFDTDDTRIYRLVRSRP